MWKSACALLLQKIACSLPVWNVDDLNTDRYYYKNPKFTDAIFAKIVFYLQNLNIWGKRLENAINTWQAFTHDWIRHLSCTGLNVCRLDPKKWNILNVWMPVLDTFLYKVRDEIKHFWLLAKIIKWRFSHLLNLTVNLLFCSVNLKYSWNIFIRD